jgi:hypothetical protein
VLSIIWLVVHAVPTNWSLVGHFPITGNKQGKLPSFDLSSGLFLVFSLANTSSYEDNSLLGETGKQMAGSREFLCPEQGFDCRVQANWENTPNLEGPLKSFKNPDSRPKKRARED